MKNPLPLAVATIGVGATLAFAGTSNIADSKHNFSGGAAGETCRFCHTPHPIIDDNGVVISKGIWRVSPSSKVFALYSSETLGNISNRSSFTTDSVSLICMGCHDGSAMTNPMEITNTMWSDGNLTKTHPVNFNVASNKQTRHDGSFDLVYTEGNKYMGIRVNAFPLFASSRGATSLECSSCHMVHDNYYEPFLRSTMAGSALCFGCHNK